jgi:hypothetical protein
MPRGPEARNALPSYRQRRQGHADRATGEENEELPESTKSAAAELGRLGGEARAAKMSPSRSAEIARNAAAKR